MKLVVYIAGPMRGSLDLGRMAFNIAEGCLRARGFAVLNPARLPEDLPAEAYMPICLAMLREADIVALLPGWENSAGAKIEAAFAKEEHIKAFTIEELTTDKAGEAEE